MRHSDDGSNAMVGVGGNQVELHYGAATDVGLVREVNEDSFLADPPVFVVADGMGGHDGGDIASAMVIEEFARLADVGYDTRRGEHVVAATLRVVQRRLGEYGASHRGSDGRRWHGGTTAVAAILVDDDVEGTQWLLANLGDSRVYRYSDGVLSQVSTDHSVVQELVESGAISAEEVATHPERHVVTRALGGNQAAVADYFALALGEAERLLLCSDGITGMLSDAEIAGVLGEHADPQDAADRLVAAAVAAGGRDNATAIVVDVMGSATESSYDSERQRVSPEEKPGALP